LARNAISANNVRTIAKRHKPTQISVVENTESAIIDKHDREQNRISVATVYVVCNLSRHGFYVFTTSAKSQHAILGFGTSPL